MGASLPEGTAALRRFLEVIFGKVWREESSRCPPYGEIRTWCYVITSTTPELQGHGSRQTDGVLWINKWHNYNISIGFRIRIYMQNNINCQTKWIIVAKKIWCTSPGIRGAGPPSQLVHLQLEALQLSKQLLLKHRRTIVCLRPNV